MKLSESILDKGNQLYDLSQQRNALQDLLTEELRELKLKVIDGHPMKGVPVAKVLAVNATGIGSVLVRFLPVTKGGGVSSRERVVVLRDLEVIHAPDG